MPSLSANNLQGTEKYKESRAELTSSDKKIYDKLCPAIIVLISALLIIVWFKDGLLYGGGDVGMTYYEPEHIFNWIRYTWFEITAPGFTYPQTLTSIPFYYFLSILKVAGLPDAAAQALIWYLALVGSGLSMYYLARMVTSMMAQDGKSGHTAPMISALFYMFNAYTMLQVWHRGTQVLVTFMPLLPLLLMVVIRGFDCEKIFQPAIAISMIMFFLTFPFGAPGLIITAWIIVFSYPAFRLLENRSASQTIFTVKFLGLSIILWFIFNIWWIVPITYSYLTPATIGYTRLISTGIGSAPLIEVFRLVQNWWFSVDPHLASYPFKEALRQVSPALAYQLNLIWQPLFLAVSFVIPAIVYLPLFTSRRNRMVIFFTVLSLIGIFLAKGSAPPFGDLLETLVAEVPLFIGVRNTYEKFGPIIALGYSILFGLGASYLSSLLSKLTFRRVVDNGKKDGFKRKTTLILLIFIVFLLTSWPMWTGDVWKTRGIVPGDYEKDITRVVSYEVPHYHLEAAEWLSSQGDIRIILAPISPGDSVTLNWIHGYSGLVPYANTLRKPVMGSTHGAEYLREAVAWFNTQIFHIPAWKLMAIFNAKYILIDGDLDYKSRNMENPFEIKEILDKQTDVRLVKTFGKLAFYEINETRYVKKIYVTNRSMLAETIQSSYDIMANETFTPGKDVVLYYSNTSKLVAEEIKLGKNPPTINFEKLDPTRYTVNVSNATGAYFLIFGESYHPYWKATTEGEPIPEQYHFLGNGYANAWYISKTGSYTIMLEFMAQQVFESCALISVTAFLLCSIYYVYTVKSRKRVYNKVA